MRFFCFFFYKVRQNLHFKRLLINQKIFRYSCQFEPMKIVYAYNQKQEKKKTRQFQIAFKNLKSGQNVLNNYSTFGKGYLSIRRKRQFSTVIFN